MRRLLVLLSVVLICCLPVMTVNAQTASSTSLTGQVVDPQGAVITDATVTATDVATGVAAGVPVAAAVPAGFLSFVSFDTVPARAFKMVAMSLALAYLR